MAPPSPADKKTGASKNLEDQEWYHGFRPRKDAIKLITAPGQFLVRATDTGPSTDIVITAMDDKMKTVNITLKLQHDTAQWYLAQKSAGIPVKHKFPTIVELVEHYRVNPPSKALRLSVIVARPNWMLKHENVQYEEKDKLGAGNFCTVYKGKMQRKTGETITTAVKISLVAAAATDAESDDAKEARRAMMHEAQIMSFYTHENVIQFYGVACDHQPVLVLMEFCPGGDLLSHLLKHGKATEDREKLIYLFEAARGMFYLHSKRCVHRDLAARNCLISEQGRIKIADFGLSKLIDEPENDAAEGGAATAKSHSNAQVPVRWMAPETLRKEAPQYTTKSDVWAFGVMTYEIWNNGIKPWPEDPVKYVATQIRKGNMPKMPESTPSKVADLVAKMWTVKADARPHMRVIARDCNMLLRETSGHGQCPSDKMTINLIPGVKRTVFYDTESTSEFDDTSADSDSGSTPYPVDKVDKSNDKRRTKKTKKTSSLRETKESKESKSVDK